MSRSNFWLWPCAFVTLLGTSSCYKATFYQNRNAIGGIHHERWSAFFVFGLVGSEHFDVRDFCGRDEAAEIRTGGNFATSLVSAVTIGIYTPRKVYITCAAKPGRVLSRASRRLELSLDSTGRPVHAEIETAHGATRLGHIEHNGAQRYTVSMEDISL
ncbi:MAG: Bor protein [Pseudomonadota bacterium]